MTDQQADDVIAEARKLLRAYEADGEGRGLPFYCPAPLVAALVERVTRQPQENYNAEVVQLRDTVRRLNRRCQIAEAAANLNADQWDKRSKRQGRTYIYNLGRQHAFAAPADREALHRSVVGALRSFIAAHGPSLEDSGLGSAATRVVGAVCALLRAEPEVEPAASVSSQQEPPKEQKLRQALKEIRYMCKDVELGNWFALDAIAQIIVTCESVDDDPAPEAHQQEPEQGWKPIVPFLDCPRQHPHAGACHDTIGPLHVSWLAGELAAALPDPPAQILTQGQTHEGHEEEQRTKS